MVFLLWDFYFLFICNMKLFARLIILICFVFQGNFMLYSQYLGTWNVLQLRHKFQKDWIINGETQLRSLSFYKQFHYYEYKASIQKQLTKDCGISLGVGKYNTFSPGGNFNKPQVANEIRASVQLFLSQRVKKLEIENRYRFEIRKFPSSPELKFRVRYRLGIAYPILKDGKIKLTLANEFFSSISAYTIASQSIFEKNRLSCGMQLKPSDMLQFSIGYLRQYDTRNFDETGKHFFQLVTTITL